MSKQTRFLLIASLISLTAIVGLQLYWLHNYYLVSKERFFMISNAAVKKSAEKEFIHRMDSLERGIKAYLSDTAKTEIHSRFLSKYKMHQYFLSSKGDTADKYVFSHLDLKGPVVQQGDSMFRVVAAKHASHYRTDNLEKNVIWYTPERLGFFADSLRLHYVFDSTAFRHYLQTLLQHKGIDNRFRLYTGTSETLQPADPWYTEMVSEPVTVSYPKGKPMVVQVGFSSPVGFLINEMLFVILGSVALVSITSFCFYRILRGLITEKRLAAVKNDFISNITHEFKTPIATVSAALEALQHYGGYADEQKRRKYFSAAETELDRLSEMVNKILNISIYEKTQIEMHKTSFSVGDVLEEIIRNYEMIRTKTIVWKTEILGSDLISADRELIHIALSNIIDNAIKYSFDPVRIEIDVSNHPSAVMIRITDDGIGIDEKDAAHVFEKFYRVNTAMKNKVKGYGLGLSYTKAILDAHGGEYRIRPGAQKGTAVDITLPKS
jgi:two-component system phosphate regulon sensor histidine kinase PhoR